MDRQRRLRDRGYSAVEVLVAMTLFAVGASGVIAMIRANVQGNYDARTLDVANSVARAWEERLRRDASYWTKSPTGVSGNAVSTTKWLKNTADAPAVWFVPAAPASPNHEGQSPAFDLLGRELADTDAQDATKTLFCTQLRLTWLVPNSVVRAEVRVFWPRAGQAGVACTDAAATGAALDALDSNAKWRFVQTQNAIRGNFQ